MFYPHERSADSLASLECLSALELWVTKLELLKVGATLKIFVDGDGDLQTGLAKVDLLPTFPAAQASAVGGATPQFLGYVIGRYSVDFEDRFDTIQITFFAERSCVQALVALFSNTND